MIQFSFSPLQTPQLSSTAVPPVTPAQSCGSVVSSHPTINNIDNNSNEISGFPYEAQELVILNASVKALEYLAATEEDVELYIPLVANLKQDYKEKISILQTRAMPAQQQQRR